MSHVSYMSWVMSTEGEGDLSEVHESCLLHVMSHVSYMSWVMSPFCYESCLVSLPPPPPPFGYPSKPHIWELPLVAAAKNPEHKHEKSLEDTVLRSNFSCVSFFRFFFQVLRQIYPQLEKARGTTIKLVELLLFLGSFPYSISLSRRLPEILHSHLYVQSHLYVRLMQSSQGPGLRTKPKNKS